MGFVKRRANTKAKITVEDFEAVKAQFLIDIKAVVEFDKIPHELIILLPYIIEKRKELKLSADYPALVLYDNFTGQGTQELFDILQSKFLLIAQIDYSLLM